MVDSSQVDTLKMVVILVINPLKIVIMEIRKYMKTLPLVAAMLLIASCSSEDSEITEAPQVAKTILIPYEATVSSGSQTRATLVGDCYNFQSGDKLFVYDDNNKISGELTLTSGAGTNEAVFGGTLTYTPNPGDPATPANNLSLRAVLKGVSDNLLPSTVGEYKSSGANYSTAIGSSLTDAVEKYSHFTAVSNYEYKNFTSLLQRSTFVSFAITLEDGTAAGENITVTIKNGGSTICSGSVTTIEEDSKIKAKFTAALEGYTKLNGATVTLGDRDAISFGGSKTLYVNYKYSVTKTYTKYKITATAATLPINKELTNLDIPKNTTLGDLLGDNVALLSGLSVKSGDNITFGEYSGASTPVTISDIGTTVITVSATFMGYPITDDVTLVVSKMTPAAE